MKMVCSLLFKLPSCLIILSVICRLSLIPQTGDPFARHRESLRKKIGSGVAIIPSEHPGRTDNRPSKNFYYLAGLAETGAVLILTATEGQKEILFSSSRQRDQKDTAISLERRPLEQLRSFLYPLIKNKETFYIPFGDIAIFTDLAGNPGIFSEFDELRNIDPLVNEMRLVKSEYELLKLQTAIDITAEALNEAYRAALPGMREVDLKSILHYVMKRLDGEEGFTQVASGPNSTFIHFGATDRKMLSDDIIVFDFGVYYDNYVADISRTIPVNGRFTKEQREIYSIVLRAQQEGINLMKPGASYQKCEKEVESVLIDGLHGIGLVTDTSIPWQRKLYILHGFSHGIGLDVHDAYQHWQKKKPEEKLFRAGMVYTMEPGLYFPEHMLDSVPRHVQGMVEAGEFTSYAEKVKNLYRKYVNIGVRIEDDVLITGGGNRILSTKVPKEIGAVEKLMKERSSLDSFAR